jgi:hypothetical protein
MVAKPTQGSLGETQFITTASAVPLQSIDIKIP